MASFSQGVVVSEVGLWPNKLEVAKRLKSCIGGMTFVKVLEASTILACFENFLKSKFIVIGKSAITSVLCISCYCR